MNDHQEICNKSKEDNEGIVCESMITRERDLLLNLNTKVQAASCEDAPDSIKPECSERWLFNGEGQLPLKAMKNALCKSLSHYKIAVNKMWSFVIKKMYLSNVHIAASSIAIVYLLNSIQCFRLNILFDITATIIKPVCFGI